MHLDATLYILAAVFGYLATQFGADTAARILPEGWLFWVQTVVGAAFQGVLALKLFRSETFSKWKQTQPTVTNGKSVEIKETKVTDGESVKHEETTITSPATSNP